MKYKQMIEQMTLEEILQSNLLKEITKHPIQSDRVFFIDKITC
jgi:hypothetical protein